METSPEFLPISLLTDLPGEVWKPIPEFPKYEVSNLGRVKHWHKIMKVHFRPDGYSQIQISRDGMIYHKRLHALICAAFNGPPPFADAKALHRDDDRTNNNPNNLYWGTPKQNSIDAVVNKRYKRQQ